MQACNRGFGFDDNWVVSRSVIKNHTELATACEGGKQNGVIMGKITAGTIPDRAMPLPKRRTLIVSKEWATQSPERYKGKDLHFFSDFEQAVSYYYKKLDASNLFVIGGQRLFEEAIVSKHCENINIAEIDFGKTIDCDVFFPKIPDNFKLVGVSEPVEEDIKVKGEQILAKITFKTYTNTTFVES